MSYIILLFQAFLLFNYSLLGNCELKLVAEFFRHGARQVIFDYWNAEIFPDWGALTSVGMRMHYVLGQTLRERYIEDLQFLSPNFNYNEMYLQSTDVNRTLRSALSQLYGFYPIEFGPYLPIDLPSDIVYKKYYYQKNLKLLPPWPNITQTFNSQETLPKLFQPFPLHTQLSKYDYLLKAYDPNTCPINTKLQQEQIQSSEYQNILSVIESNLLKIAKLINYTSETINFAQAYEMMDVFQDDIFWNKPLPAGLSPTETPALWKDLTFAYNLYMYIEMYASETQKKLVATPFFDELEAIFEQRLNNQSSVKWRMYSAHDTTIGMLVSALNLTNYQCMYDIYRYGYTNATQCIYDYPSFATSLIVELYEETNSSKYVKVLYNGEYQKLCQSNNTQCDYNEFLSRMNSFKMPFNEFLTLCHEESEQVQKVNKQTEEIKLQEQNSELRVDSIGEHYQVLIANKIPNKISTKQIENTNNEQLINLKTKLIVSFCLMGVIIFFIVLVILQKRSETKQSVHVFDANQLSVY